MEGLTPGRIVHYVEYNQDHLAAIIIRSNQSGYVDLVVFTNQYTNRNGEEYAGMIFHSGVTYSEDNGSGTWHWTEKE